MFIFQFVPFSLESTDFMPGFMPLNPDLKYFLTRYLLKTGMLFDVNANSPNR